MKGYKMKLAERAVLMRLSVGLPGQHRKDKKTTEEVKAARALGSEAGKWITDLWPEYALAAVKTLQNEARAYHDKVTFPFGSRSDEDNQSATSAIAGIGILPAALIEEYKGKMADFRNRLEGLVHTFVNSGEEWIAWARAQHNGTFNPKNYPGASDAGFDSETFVEKMRKKFYLVTEPLPIPGAEQFTEAVTALLGVDVEGVNVRVRDAGHEAQRELMRRLIEPVKAMAVKLAEQPKEGKDTPVFRDTLIGNLKEIVELAPKLNLSDDPHIEKFVKELQGLTNYAPEVLRKDGATREEAARKARETLARLEGYKL